MRKHAGDKEKNLAIKIDWGKKPREMSLENISSSKKVIIQDITKEINRKRYMLKSLNQVYRDRLVKGAPEGNRNAAKEGSSRTAEAEKTLSPGIPKLKNTNEAMAYGEKVLANDPAKYKEFQDERQRLLGESAKIADMGEKSTSEDLQRGMNIGFEAQMMREAMETADRKKQQDRSDKR